MDPQNNNILPNEKQPQEVPQNPSNLAQEKVEQPTKREELVIQDNDYAVVYESEKYMRLIPIRAGDRFQTTDGAYKHNHIVGHPWG